MDGVPLAEDKFAFYFFEVFDAVQRAVSDPGITVSFLVGC